MPSTADQKWIHASVASFNGSRHGDYTDPHAFYLSYLQYKKEQYDFRAMKLAKEHREWIWKFAAKVIRRRQQNGTLPPTETTHPYRVRYSPPLPCCQRSAVRCWRRVPKDLQWETLHLPSAWAAPVGAGVHRREEPDAGEAPATGSGLRTFTSRAGSFADLPDTKHRAHAPIVRSDKVPALSSLTTGDFPLCAIAVFDLAIRFGGGVSRHPSVLHEDAMHWACERR